MELQILIPQYKETNDVIRPLLDSIAIQQNIDFNKIGVIIVNDGSNVKLSEDFLASYPFKIEYHQNEHKGVSATRNKCLDLATAKYVMFCDADDMFYNACGLYIIMREINSGGFDTLTSAFIEETRFAKTKEIVYVNHDIDSTFVHGKVHRRQFLLDNNIRWNDNLTIHEDSYFNILCQRLAKNNAKYCPTSFYLWKWRDESVCRHDSKYILKTYNNMIDSNSALVKQFLQRDCFEDAQFYVSFMVYDAYYTMNKSEWINQENKTYRDSVELCFKKYYNEFKTIFDNTPIQTKTQVIQNIRIRMFEEGLLMESITFDTWIKHIEELPTEV